jgi:hypothetical protein
MEKWVPKSAFNGDWKELYKAALFEDDHAKMPQRIAEAESALAARAGELFGAGENQVRERQAMENAMYFLRLLRKTDGSVNTSGGQGKQDDASGQAPG